MTLTDALAPLDRAVVVLRYWDDRSIEQTAAILSTSTGTIKTRSKRAVAKVRAALPDLTLPAPSESVAPIHRRDEPERSKRASGAVRRPSRRPSTSSFVELVADLAAGHQRTPAAMRPWVGSVADGPGGPPEWQLRQHSRDYGCQLAANGTIKIGPSWTRAEDSSPNPA